MSLERVKSYVFSVALSIVKNFASRLVNELWSEFVETLVDAATEAEEKWRDWGYGAEKKKEVVEYLMSFVEGKMKLNIITRPAVKIVVSKAVDSLIGTFNDTFGESWGVQMRSTLQKVAARIPLLD